VVDPKLTPVAWGWTEGVVCPAAMLTMLGEMVTFPLLVPSVMVTGADGAADKLTG